MYIIFRNSLVSYNCINSCLWWKHCDLLKNFYCFEWETINSFPVSRTYSRIFHVSETLFWTFSRTRSRWIWKKKEFLNLLQRFLELKHKQLLEKFRMETGTGIPVEPYVQEMKMTVKGSGYLLYELIFIYFKICTYNK